METLVCDIHCIISALSEDCTAVVVAHDWGGAVAYAFAQVQNYFSEISNS
jgi:pimeloyl-ACP methyl ester carboxylesterase